jgi:hypothetical protein
MTDKISKVPNLAKTATDKIIDARLAMEEEAPSAPISYTPSGTIVQAMPGAKVEYAEVSVNDLAQASGITSDPNKLKLEQDNRHITDGKIYFNSPEFNALRRELYENHREVFDTIGGYMVHDPFTFVMRMNTWLGTKVQFDNWNEAGICAQFLQALANKRNFGAVITTKH